MFNKNHIYFKQGPKTVIMINSLYVITHILKKYKDIAFARVETRETTTLTTIDDKSKNEVIKEKELE